MKPPHQSPMADRSARAEGGWGRRAAASLATALATWAAVGLLVQAAEPVRLEAVWSQQQAEAQRVIALLRWHDQTNVMAALSGERQPDELPGLLAEVARQALNQGVTEADIQAAKDRHRTCARRWFGRVGEAIVACQGWPKDRTAAEYVVMAARALATAEREYERSLAAGESPLVALDLALRAQAWTEGIADLPAGPVAFAGEADRIAAALAGETAAEAVAGRDPAAPAAPGSKPDPGVTGTPKPGTQTQAGPGAAGTPAQQAPGSTTGAGPDAIAAAELLTYREISAFPGGVVVDNGVYPVLSRNGQRVVVPFAPDKADLEKKERVGVINADGSGFQTVDAYVPLRYTNVAVDISADGAWVASSDGHQIRVVSAAGGQARTVVRVDNNIGALRLAGDGSRVFFLLWGDSVLTRTKERLECGVYVVKADGSGLRKVVGATEIAPVTGYEAGARFSLSSGSRGRALDVSDDGRRLVFVVDKRYGPGLALAVNGDGSGLTKVFSAASRVNAVGISGDGRRIGLVATLKSSGGYEGWVVGEDGSEARKLTDKGWHAGHVSLTVDGSRVVFGNEAVLYDTAGASRLPIATPAAVTGARLSPGTLMHLTMDRTGRRFVWVDATAKGGPQLVRVDVAPADLAGAPSLADVRLSAEALPADGRTAATISARVVSDKAVVGGIVTPVAYLDGRPDDKVGRAAAMYDRGQDADQAAGDGVFTSNLLIAAPASVTGPRVLRLMVEVADADDRRLATAVPVKALSVTAGK